MVNNTFEEINEAKSVKKKIEFPKLIGQFERSISSVLKSDDGNKPESYFFVTENKKQWNYYNLTSNGTKCKLFHILIIYGTSNVQIEY